MENHLPHLENVNGQWRLIVDGEPFLILGLQWDCDSCFSAEQMNPLFPHAAKMGANTAALPTYWKEIEPEPGRYDFQMVEERIQQAKAHNMRLVLLWFATWKNASALYAPEYICNDPVTYPLVVDNKGSPSVSLCPSSENTWQRDRTALLALMNYLREHDDTHRVILFQPENEAGVLYTDRCYCATCSQRFAEEKWEERYGVHAAERFSVSSIATYIDRLAEEAKAVYPLPMYTNVWLTTEVGGIPGHYPSGGAVPEVLQQYRNCAPHIDLVGPDIYFFGYRDFHRLCQQYAADGNPLYIAETSSSLNGRAERNVFYAIGQYSAIGFDPWAIDSPAPEDSVPLVDNVGGEWALQAYWLRDSYVAISRAMQPIIQAQGTSRLFTMVQEPGEFGSGWVADGCDVIVQYKDRDNMARGMIIQESKNEFILVGMSYYAQFRRSRPDGRPIPIAHAEWGYYVGDRWVTLHPVRRETLASLGSPVYLQEPGVMRVFLNL